MLLLILLLSLFFTGCNSSSGKQPQQEQPASGNITEYHPWYSAKIDSLEKVIYDVAYALKVPYDEKNKSSRSNIYTNVIRDEDKSTSNPRRIYLRVLLNREIVDLTYANIIVKQELVKAGGKFIDGRVFANWKNYLLGQMLTFRTQDEAFEYIIRLVYDNSPYTDLEQSQEISVILTELGDNQEVILDNLELIKKNNLTLAFVGDCKFSDSLSALAVSNNIETMLAIPLESYPGHNAMSRIKEIKVKNPLDKNYIGKQIAGFKKPVQGIKGITHFWGDFATSEADFMQHIIDYCKDNQLYYIDAMTTSKSKGYELALRKQVLSTWALSYQQVTKKNLASYVSKNKYPTIIIKFETDKDVEQLKKLISLIDKNQFRIVSVTDLLNTDLPKIE